MDKIDLAMVNVCTPFYDYFGSFLDLKGEWTQEMLDHFDEYQNEEKTGLRVWKGTCEIKSDDDIKYIFEGKWRNLTHEEMLNLMNGIMPLTLRQFPSIDECILIPEC